MCAFIFVMSAFPAEESDALSTGAIWHIVGFIVPGYDQLPAAEQLQWQQALQFPVRKTAHFLEYALLGALAFNLVIRMKSFRHAPRARQVLVAWAFAVVYAIGDEIHQLFVPGRTGKIMDVGIDAAGALCGIAVVLLILWIAGKLHARKHNATSG